MPHEGQGIVVTRLKRQTFNLAFKWLDEMKKFKKIQLYPARQDMAKKKYHEVDIELSKIGKSPIYDKDNIKRASKADYTKLPIVAVDLGTNGVGVLDGNHRVFQARKDKKTKLKGYLIPLEAIKKYIIKKEEI